MLKGLKRLAGGGLLLLELRGLRKELADLQQSVGRIAAALEASNAHAWPRKSATSSAPDLEPTTVTFVDNAEQEAFANIELALTRVRGIPPTEDEVMAEFERCFPGRS